MNNHTLAQTDERIITAAKGVIDALNAMLEISMGICDGDINATFDEMHNFSNELTEALKVPNKPADLALEYVATANRTLNDVRPILLAIHRSDEV